MKNAIIVILSVLLLGSIVGNVLEYERYSNSRPLLRLDGGAITRKEYQDRLDHLYGKQVLNKITYQKIIHNAAAKAGLLATDKDIDERLNEIDRRNSALLAGAKKDPTMMADLREDLAQDIEFENLRIKDIKVSDADVEAYYRTHQSLFALPTQVETTIVVARNEVDAATAKGLLQQGMTGTQIANVPNLRVAGVGGYALPPNIPAGLRTQLMQMVGRLKDKEIGTIAAGGGYLVIRDNRHSSAGVPPMAEVKPLVTRLCRLEKAQSPEIVLAQLFRDANVQFEVSNYAPFFDDMTEEVKKLNSATVRSAASPKP